MRTIPGPLGELIDPRDHERQRWADAGLLHPEDVERQKWAAAGLLPPSATRDSTGGTDATIAKGPANVAQATAARDAAAAVLDELHDSDPKRPIAAVRGDGKIGLFTRPGGA